MRVILLGLFLFCFAGVAEAQLCTGAVTSCTAASASSVDVQTALNTASDGDTVNIPSGTATWNRNLGQCGLTNPVNSATCGQVRISGKGVHLKGAAGGQTVIGCSWSGSSQDGNNCLRIEEDPDVNVELSNIAWANGSTPWYAMEAHPVSNGKPIRFHDLSCANGNCPSRLIRFFMSRGIFYENTLNSEDDNGFGAQLISCRGHINWDTAATYGILDVNGTNHLYIEDNTTVDMGSIDNDDNCRIVSRFNSYTNTAHSSHGRDTSTHGGRQWEVYNNSMFFTHTNVQWAFQVRGASWRVTGNTIQSVPGKSLITIKIDALQHASNPSATYHCYGKGIPGIQYPMPHAAGQGHNGTSQATEGIWFWDNTATYTVSLSNFNASGTVCANHCDVSTTGQGHSVSNTNDPNCDAGGTVDTVAQHMVEGRDYFIENGAPTASYGTYTKCTGRPDLGCNYPHPQRHDSSGEPPPIDTTDPTVVISSPSPFSDTMSTTTTATGTCSDDTACLATGTATNSLNSDTAGVTVSGGVVTMAAIDLDLGINPVTVAIEDAAGNEGTDIFSVLRENCGSAYPYSNSFSLSGDGTDWSTPGPCFSQVGTGTRPTIVANKLSFSGDSCEAYNGQVIPANHSSAGKIGGTSGNSGIRFMVRMAGVGQPNDARYGIFLQVAPTNTFIGRYMGPFGFDHVYASYTSQISTPVNDQTTARLEITGNIATGFVDIDGPGGSAEVQLTPSVDVSQVVTNGAYPIANGPAGVCATAATRTVDDWTVDEVDPAPADTEAPVVDILEPTVDGVITTDTEIAIGHLNGTATDGGGSGLDRCEHNNSQDPGVFVALTLVDGAWSNPAAIALTIGTNIITVRCYDGDENASVDENSRVTVVRDNPPDPNPPVRKVRRNRIKAS